MLRRLVLGLLISAVLNIAAMIITVLAMTRTGRITTVQFSFYRFLASIIVMAIVISVVILIFEWLYRWITFAD
jgi:hypothetical protein